MSAGPHDGARHGRRRARELSPADRDQLAQRLAARYRDGASLQALATDTGVSYGLVRRLLLDQGVELRPRGGDRYRRPPRNPEPPT